MNVSSNPWSQNSPAVYKKVFKMVANVMHNEAPNVAMVWSPNYVPIEQIDDYYPGNDAVDWVGINAYTDRYYIGNPDTKQLIQDIYYQGYYADPLDRFEYIYNTYSPKKPIMIAETGVQNFAINTDQDFGKWAANNIRKLYNYLPMKYPRIKGIFYFNVDSDLAPELDLKQNYCLSKNSLVTNAYKESIENPYYLTNINDEVNYQYKSLSKVELRNNNKMELFCYTNLIDPFINKVEYWLDGQKIGQKEKIPFNISIDLESLSNGEHMLRIDAYNGENQLSARKSYNVIVQNENIKFSSNDLKYIPKHKSLKDIDNHWAKDQIQELVSMHSIDGYNDDTFKPQKQITKAEFYKLLSTSLGMGLKVDTDYMNNIKDGHWAKKLLEGGVQLDIIDLSKYPDGFGADSPVTRGEMAMWTVRALNGGEDLEPVKTNFIDDGDIPQQYKGYIDKAYDIGVIDGFPDNTFRASETATRAQAVSIVIRAIEYQHNK